MDGNTGRSTAHSSNVGAREKPGPIPTTSRNRLGSGLRPVRHLALVLAVGLAFVFPGTGAAQDGESLVVGTSTLAWTSDWELLGGGDESATWQHRDLPFTLFDYSEYPDGAYDASDNAELIELSRISALEKLEVVSGIKRIGRGTLPDGTLWELYSLRLDSDPFLFVASANMDILPKVDVVATLLTPEIELVAAHVAASADITVNGESNPVTRIDQGEIVEAAMAWLLEQDQAADRPRIPLPNPAP